ncbi:MAG TPA: serine hydrolase [Candidatus Saccharimonadales bacterium]|nr:serine hydrolase [Candidatus Saccharimonadales bacterium]
MRKAARFIGIGVLLIATGYLGMLAWQTQGPASDNTIGTEVAAKSYLVNPQALSDIQAVVDQRTDLDLSVSLTDLQTGKSYHYGDNSAFTAASIGKLITAAAFMNDVEKGTASLTDSVGNTSANTAIQKMLVESDNTSWAAMKNKVTLDGQQAYAESIGMTTYDAAANTMSSSDVALLLAKLSSGKLLTTSHTGKLLSYMEQANYRGYIVNAIPAGTSVYHKVGLLEDRVHDAAIIKRGDRSYVLVIFSKSPYGAYDFADGASLFGSITADSLRAFF